MANGWNKTACGDMCDMLAKSQNGYLFFFFISGLLDLKN